MTRIKLLKIRLGINLIKHTNFHGVITHMQLIFLNSVESPILGTKYKATDPNLSHSITIDITKEIRSVTLVYQMKTYVATGGKVRV